MKQYKWTVMFKTGRFEPVQQRRFLAPRNFQKAKNLALRLINGKEYCGLYIWSDYDFQLAVQKAKIVRAQKKWRRYGTGRKLKHDQAKFEDFRISKRMESL